MIQAKKFENDRERVMWNLTLHPSTSAEQIAAFEELRASAISFANTVLLECPLSRERSLALTSLEDALQYAIASIARAEVV